MKKLKNLLFIICLVVLGVSLVSCKTKGNEETKVVKIGILQLATHSALDSAREGFIDQLKEAGYVDKQNISITVKNPEGDPNTVNQMATDLVRSCDLVLGIATDAAVALQNAAEIEGKNIPILFTAVTDAVKAGLVESNEKPGKNVTGTSDINPVKEQIQLLKELLPDTKKFGIIYKVSEINSGVQADLAKAEAVNQNLECKVRTVSDASDIAATVSALISDGCTAIYIPTDNLIAANMPAVTSVTDEKKIPTICGEAGCVLGGGTITYGVNYYALGKQTANQAIQILFNNVSPSNIPVGMQTSPEELDIVINEESVNKLGITIPDSIKKRMK